jgi:hypothetical protein
MPRKSRKGFKNDDFREFIQLLARLIARTAISTRRPTDAANEGPILEPRIATVKSPRKNK